MIKHRRWCLPLALLLIAVGLRGATPSSAATTINVGFPGGNALVDKTEGNTVHLRPDLRGGKAWFYWYFEATSDGPGRATFVFPTNSIGVQGPAMSLDDGKSWRWMGADKVTVTPPAAGAPVRSGHESFDYDFARANEKVRFSVGIPYVQSNLDSFLAGYGKNPHLARSVLTKSLKGRAVEFLQIGKPGPGKRGLLLTARHHACEALASYVLEGFLKEAMSESPAAVKFRETHVLYVVPFVDKDGVEDGDQGKNRSPHDHNRDYGDAPMYPEIKAIQEFAARTPIQLSLDLHCPALKGDIHEAFHFLGLGVPHVKDNLNEWIGWMSEERPPTLGTPLNYLVDGSKPNAVNTAINSHYFATREGALMAATLEIPYTQVNSGLDADMARGYGAAMLKTMNRPQYLTAAPGAASGGTRGAAAHAELLALRKTFTSSFRRTPDEMEALANRFLEDPHSSPVYRAEANLMLAQVRLVQKRFADAVPFATAVAGDGSALTAQQVQGLVLRQRALAADTTTAPRLFDDALAGALRYPFLSDTQQAQLYTAAVDFYQQRGELDTAIAHGRRLYPFSAYYEKGKTLLRIASLHDLAGRPDKATATRREAVAVLQKMVIPKAQRSSMGAMMVTDLFDAVMGIPTSTAEEKQAAADIALNHDVVAVGVKDRIRKAMGMPAPTAVQPATP